MNDGGAGASGGGSVPQPPHLVAGDLAWGPALGRGFLLSYTLL